MIKISNMKRIFTLLFLLPSLFLSCKPVQTNVIDFANAIDNNETPLLSSIASDVRYIPLETKYESVIDSPTEIFISDSEIIVECHRMRFFRVFDLDGNYLGTIDRQGNGPEEYKTFFDSAFEKDNNAVSVLERKVIKRYNTKGDYIGSIQLDESDPRYYRSLEYLGNGLYKLDASLNDSVQLMIFNSEGKEVNTAFAGVAFTQRYGEISLTVPPSTTYGNDRFLVLSVRNDTIYQFDSNLEKSIAYLIDCGKYDYLYKSDDMMNMIQLGFSYIDSENFFILGMSLPKNEFTHMKNDDNVGNNILIYDKSSGKTYIPKHDRRYKIAGFENDIDNGPTFSPSYMVGNKVYSFIDAIDFIDYARISESQQVKDVAAKLTEESNPVLMEVTLK